MPEGEVTGTFGDYSESNSNAREHPSVYEVCQQSGFLVKPKELVRQWDGAWVRYDFVDKRNPQDFVRGIKARSSGSFEPPEDADEFLEHSQFIATEDERLIGSEANSAVKTEEPVAQITAEDL